MSATYHFIVAHMVTIWAIALKIIFNLENSSDCKISIVVEIYIQIENHISPYG